MHVPHRRVGILSALLFAGLWDAEAEAEKTGTNSTGKTVAAATPGVSIEDLPGALIFEGTYRHRSRGAEIAPGMLWLKQAPDGTLIAVSHLSAYGATCVAYGALDGGFVRYRQCTAASDRGPASERSLVLSDGKATFTKTGQDGKEETQELTAPAGAVFDPNSRPDPYCAAPLLLRHYHVRPGKKKEFKAYDWDNTGKGMAGYTVQIENIGKEKIEVPAGTCEAYHLVQTQTTSGDTWYKKRAGHITDFWVLENGVIVRIVRHREPYQLELLEYRSPQPLPGI